MEDWNFKEVAPPRKQGDPFSDVVRPGTGAVISLQGKLGIDNNTNEGNAVSVNRKEYVNIASA